MTPAKHLSLALLAITFALGACQKDDEEPATPSGGGGGTPVTPEEPSTTPTFPDAHGTLWAVKSFSSTATPIGPIDFEMGLGIAAFSNNGFTTNVNVGDVALNGTALTPGSTGAYTSVSPTSIVDIDVSSVEWVVAGGNGFAGFTRTVNDFPLPGVGTVTSAENVVRSDGYTLSCSFTGDADSVLFMVGGVAKTLEGGSSSCTFSAAELSGLAAGANMVQIAAYSYSSEVIGGKNIYFGKETVRSKSVTIE